MSTINDNVNLAQGDTISAYAGRIIRATQNYSPFVSVTPRDEHFRGNTPFRILQLLPELDMVLGPDGIGTKVALIDAAGSYKTAAQDLIAMTAGDLTKFGGCPIYFTSVLDVSRLGKDESSETFQAAKLLFDGLDVWAKILKFACIKGETAELGPCVSSPNPNAVFPFNWGGFMTGVSHIDKEINGTTLAPGQIIVALKENGFRSNGISAVRATMEKQFGPDWWSMEEFVKAIATPSTIYDHLFTHLNGWHNGENNFETIIKPHFICHLSGGSFSSKLFGDILKPKGLSAVLDQLWEPADIVTKCALWSAMSDHDLYEKWSCGQGALVVLDSKDVYEFIHQAKAFGIEAKVAGEITHETKSTLAIKSMFSGKTFRYV
jgi:phosphoribosylformylglycinamidine cyclo-ligase